MTQSCYLYVTVSRSTASRINGFIVQNLFNPNLFVGTVQTDNDEPPSNIYQSMSIILMQNRDKKNKIVNSQPGIVHTKKGLKVLLKLANGNIVSVYPVSTITTQPHENEETCVKTMLPFSVWIFSDHLQFPGTDT